MSALGTARALQINTAIQENDAVFTRYSTCCERIAKLYSLIRRLERLHPSYVFNYDWLQGNVERALAESELAMTVEARMRSIESKFIALALKDVGCSLWPVHRDAFNLLLASSKLYTDGGLDDREWGVLCLGFKSLNRGQYDSVEAELASDMGALGMATRHGSMSIPLSIASTGTHDSHPSLASTALPPGPSAPLLGLSTHKSSGSIPLRTMHTIAALPTNSPGLHTLRPSVSVSSNLSLHMLKPSMRVSSNLSAHAMEKPLPTRPSMPHLSGIAARRVDSPFASADADAASVNTTVTPPLPPEVDKPSWMPEYAWQNISVLRSVIGGPFAAVMQDMAKDLFGKWQALMTSATPHTAELPGVYRTSFSPFQRLLLTRALRPDAMALAVPQFVEQLSGDTVPTNNAVDRLAWLQEHTRSFIPILLTCDTGDHGTSLINSVGRYFRQQSINFINMGGWRIEPLEQTILSSADRGVWLVLRASTASEAQLLMASTAIWRLEPQRVHPKFRLWIVVHPDSPVCSVFARTSASLYVDASAGVLENLARACVIAAAQAAVPTSWQQDSALRGFQRILFLLAASRVRKISPVFISAGA